MTISHIGQPGVGLTFDQIDAWCFNRTVATTLVVGDFVMTDDADSTTAVVATEALGNVPGNVAFSFANVILPTTAGAGAVASAVFSFGGVVVALDPATAGAVGGLVRVRFKGYARVKTTGAVVIGSGLQMQNGVTTLDDTAVAGARFVAKALIATAGAATTPCVVDGINGFGQPYAN